MDWCGKYREETLLQVSVRSKDSVKSILVRASAHEYSYAEFIKQSEKPRTIWGSFYGPVESACRPAPGASQSRFFLCLPPDALLADSTATLRPSPPRQDTPRRCLPHRCWVSAASLPRHPCDAGSVVSPALSLNASDLKFCRQRFRRSARCCVGGRLKGKFLVNCSCVN